MTTSSVKNEINPPSIPLPPPTLPLALLAPVPLTSPPVALPFLSRLLLPSLSAPLSLSALCLRRQSPPSYSLVSCACACAGTLARDALPCSLVREPLLSYPSPPTFVLDPDCSSLLTPCLDPDCSSLLTPCLDPDCSSLLTPCLDPLCSSLGFLIPCLLAGPPS
jgi:hypothetical protein